MQKEIASPRGKESTSVKRNKTQVTPKPESRLWVTYQNSFIIIGRIERKGGLAFDKEGVFQAVFGCKLGGVANLTKSF